MYSLLEKNSSRRMQLLTKEVEKLVGAQEEYTAGRITTIIFFITFVTCSSENHLYSGEGQLVTGFVDYPNYPIQQFEYSKTKAISTTDSATGETVR